MFSGCQKQNGRKSRGQRYSVVPNESATTYHAVWHHENVAFKVGRPFTYSDLAIETLLTLRELYRLTHRSTEGFAKGLMSSVVP